MADNIFASLVPSKNPLNDLPSMNFGVDYFYIFPPLLTLSSGKHISFSIPLLEMVAILAVAVNMHFRIPAGVSVEYCTVTCGRCKSD